ncbi:MAG: hypothetical protein DRP59_07380 [Spirochaetes bacterium]|nr:MAG: hypothetical protein DRP59_07380 [Spirochaetota bacterium]
MGQKDSLNLSKRIRVLIILIVFAIGTFGFYYLGDDWTLLEAFYMTIITITTVGYGEVKPLSPAGEIFTIFFIILGLSTAAILATQLAGEFIENNFKSIFGANKMKKKIAKLQNHYIVCGFGDIGSSISESLKEASIPFIVIENDEKIAEYAIMEQYLVVKGKATYDSTLKEAGIDKAKGLVICLGDDSLNMYVSLAARELNPDLLILVRGYKAGGEKRMIRAGANSVIYPLKLGGQQMAQLIIEEYAKTNKASHLEITTSGIMGYSLKMYKHYKDESIPITEIAQSTNAQSIVKLRRKDGTEMVNPSMEEMLNKGDNILLLVKEESEEDLAVKEKDSVENLYRIYPWDESYSIGISSIDEEHKKLLALINRFLKSIHTQDEKELIISTFDNLVDYTGVHFANEESFMEKHKYPGLKDHKKEHRELTRQVMELNKNRDYIFTDSIADFLISWFTNHVLTTDKKYAAFIAEKEGMR